MSKNEQQIMEHYVKQIKELSSDDKLNESQNVFALTSMDKGVLQKSGDIDETKMNIFMNKIAIFEKLYFDLDKVAMELKMSKAVMKEMNNIRKGIKELKSETFNI